MKSIFLHQTSLDDLKALIDDAVAKQFDKLQSKQPKPEMKLLNRKETAELKISLPTLHEWTKSGIVQGQRIGSRIRYNEVDITAALQRIQTVNSQKR